MQARTTRATSEADELTPHGGERLTLVRECAGLTSAELARRAHLGRAVLHELEAGDRVATPDEARRVAAALGVDLEALDPRVLLVINAGHVRVVRRGRRSGDPSSSARDRENDRGAPISADLYEEFREDYEQHFVVSPHMWDRCRTELPAKAADGAAAAMLALLDCETGGTGFNPSDVDLAAIANLDTLRDAWIALGRPAPVSAFQGWFEQKVHGEEPVIAALLDRDRAARAAAEAGVRGLAYSCERCRSRHAERARLAAMLGRAGA